MIELNFLVPMGFAKATKDHPADMQLGLARLSQEVLIRTATTKERMNRSTRLWICIHRRELENLLTSRMCSRVIRAAKEIGLIEVNDCFSVGRFSKSYRVAGGYHGAPLEWFVFRPKGNAKASSGRFWNLDSVGKWLAEQLQQFDIEMDFDLTKPWEAITVSVIQSRNHYATRCDYGRFHSIYTATPRHLRQRLRIRQSSEALHMVDVANSQPLILGLEAKSKGYHCELWLELCSRGKLYEYVAKICRCSRDKAKEKFLPAVFDRVESMQRYSVFKAMKKAFPTIVDYMIDVKREDHCQLAWDCQRRESQLFIDGVCGQLQKEGCEIPMITIHDAAMSTREGIDIIEKEIKRRYEAQGTGVTLHRYQLGKG